ncbi:hypothetical protein EUGRSUZ_E03075 [Eucalyptus grandis]|uniref:Uncharacterized protein n=2 Tax=Eucalyptus grandis TaxID=71139 RepID=A0ACC3KZK4_EUCGR|nr:hypothetical protein EUGRSUZ_E03075 [Eucalyptus grandis]
MKRNYHVFLSFRGTDVRHGFLSHLYAALDQKGIYTFVDSEELRKGEEISPTLMRAIEESRIAIIVFSEDYTSSPWCLEELLKIMECKKRNDLIVVPVFYKVEPREVRGGRERYGRAMTKHESKFGKDLQKVKRWKKALFEAGSLSGWPLNDKHEAELIQSITEELSSRLRPRSLDVAKYPVNIDSRVLMIDLWGLGGIGKTMIAKALYNAIKKQFQGCSFLAQVREKSNQSDGRVALQKQLLSEILPHTELPERLCCKKVLLVLDDVDKIDQLHALARRGNWFGQGSRIIVTSRDKHLLTSHTINCVYEHAFTNSNEVEIRRDLIDGALHYANGLPLALEVLGSFLCGRKEPAWESALHKLSKIPEPTINQVLKISFDGLDDNEREIFLDIACFFKGKRIEYIQELMGRDIVQQECCNDPGKRSRLWLLEDVEDIFCYNTIKFGTNAVKAIVLKWSPPEAIIINPDAFTNMKKLRMLILLGVHISSQAQVLLPNELRWLEWPNAVNLEFGSGSNKLVGLNVPKSHIRQLGGNFQKFRELKYINFCECKFLVSIPDLSSAPNMEKLILNRCESLVEVHPSVGNLVKLEVLSLELCSNLSNFPNTMRTKSLQTLTLAGCSKLEKFPDTDEKMEHLRSLSLGRTAIKELPASIQNIVSVKYMYLASCKNLVRLPLHIYKLKNLFYLDLDGCSNLTTFPKNLEDSIDLDGCLGFRELSCLVLSGCNLSEFTHLPTCINKYYHLGTLRVKGCELLQEIPQLPPNICVLPASNCNTLQKIPDLLGDRRSFSGDLSSCRELFCEGLDIIISGREMPKWIQPCEEHSIFFMVPWDFYDKFKGLALCVVLSPEEGKVVDVLCHVTILVNGQSVMTLGKKLWSMESDHVWLYYYSHDGLFKEKKLLRNDWSHVHVCFEAKQGSIKKCGFRLICEQKEDDLRVVFPVSPADGSNPVPPANGSNVKVFWEDSEEENSIEPGEETPIETDAEESSSPLTKKIRRS